MVQWFGSAPHVRMCEQTEQQMSSAKLSIGNLYLQYKKRLLHLVFSFQKVSRICVMLASYQQHLFPI